MTTRIQFNTSDEGRAAAEQAKVSQDLTIQPSAQERARVGHSSEAYRFQSSGGATEQIHGGTQQVQMASIHGSSAGILASAAQPGSGRPAQVIDGNTLVTLPSGMQTTVAAAVAIGALVRNSDGSYSETGR